MTMRRFGVKRVLEKMPIFKEFSADLIEALVQTLKPQVVIAGMLYFFLHFLILYSLGNYIIRMGDIGNEMYFICKGTAEVCSADGKTIFKGIEFVFRLFANSKRTSNSFARW